MITTKLTKYTKAGIDLRSLPANSANFLERIGQ